MSELLKEEQERLFSDLQELVVLMGRIRYNMVGSEFDLLVDAAKTLCVFYEHLESSEQ